MKFFVEKDFFGRHSIGTKYGMEAPDIFKGFVIVSSEFGVEQPRDIPANFRLIGPLVNLARQQPDPVIAGILEKAYSAGIPVIYVSVGTLWTLTKENTHQLAKGLSQLKNVIIIWSCATPLQRENMPSDLPDHIHIFSHVSQIQVLSSPSIKLFISHCGINSVYEAIYFSVPILAVGIIGDQLYNSDTLVERGMALSLDSNHIISNDVVDKVNDLLTKDKYRNMAKQMSRIIRTSGGAREGVQVVERAAEIGITHLFTPTRRHVPWWMYFHLDIICVFIVILVVAYAFIVKVVFGFLRSNVNNRSQAITQKKKM